MKRWIKSNIIYALSVVVVIATALCASGAEAETPAIAFDSATSAGTTAAETSFTFSHTVGASGTNRILFVGVNTSSVQNLSSVTYNGQGMTLIDSYNETYNNSYAYLYYLVAPATGTHDVVITAPSSTWMHATAASYTGASQTGVPDAWTKSRTTSAAATFSPSLTTNADNSWVVAMVVNSAGLASGAGTDTTLRGTTLDGGSMLLDSNGPVSPAGSRTLVGTSSGNAYWAGVIASFKP